MEYIVTFFTQSAAFKFERLLKSMDLKVSLMPVPRKLSSSCGIAARAVLEGELNKYIIEEVDGIYQADDFKMIYKSE